MVSHSNARALREHAGQFEHRTGHPLPQQRHLGRLEVGAGDRIEKIDDGPEHMTVAEIDGHPLPAVLPGPVTLRLRAAYEALKDADAAFGRLARVAARFLDVRLEYQGWVPFDEPFYDTFAFIARSAAARSRRRWRPS